MSKFKKITKIFKNVGQSLGLIPTNKQLAAQVPKIPAPKVPEPPAPPASAARTDTGANVAIGTSSDIKNQRVSGRSSGRSGFRTGDILGGLGRGGLSI